MGIIGWSMSIIDGMLTFPVKSKPTNEGGYNRFKTIKTSYKLLVSLLIPPFFSVPPPSLFSTSKLLLQ